MGNTRLIQQIDDRWEIDRADQEDTQNQPLIDLRGWVEIDRDIKETRTCQALEGGTRKGSSRWEIWEEGNRQRSGDVWQK